MQATRPDAGSQDRRARLGFFASLTVVMSGAFLAAAAFPAGFDWRYQVVSALASHKHNPDGALWFSSALTLSLLLLWPVTTRLWICPSFSRARRFFIGALRTGLVFGMAVGIERAVFHHFSDEIRKGHEILALLAFAALYLGVIGLYAGELRRGRGWFWPAIVVIGPMVAVGLSELLLYLDQRGVGWADFNWRETGLPVWLSFAFWQWLAVAALWLGIGGLAWLPLTADDAARNGTDEGPRNLRP